MKSEKKNHKTVEKNQSKSIKNSRGGARNGAGRKKGSVSKRSREIADKAAQEGITPLEVMLEAMKKAYKSKGGAIAAFQYAKETAPYMHPRISSVELTGRDGDPIETKMTNCPPDTDSLDSWLKAKTEIDKAYAENILATTNRAANKSPIMPG